MMESLEPQPGRTGDELDKIISALANKQRRFILHDLTANGGSASIDNLSDRISDWGIEGNRQDIQIGLLHRHLPRLVEADLIDFDCEGDMVSITEKGGLANDGRQAYIEQVLPKCM